MDELKGCPFDGFEAKMFSDFYVSEMAYSYWVECTNIDCVIPEMSTQEYDTKKQATKAWNTRQETGNPTP